jgi:hypothetical protein
MSRPSSRITGNGHATPPATVMGSPPPDPIAAGSSLADAPLVHRVRSRWSGRSAPPPFGAESER